MASTSDVIATRVMGQRELQERHPGIRLQITPVGPKCDLKGRLQDRTTRLRPTHSRFRHPWTSTVGLRMDGKGDDLSASLHL